MKKHIALNRMVRNETAEQSHIQSLTCNLLPKMVRHDTMEGRDYLVVPMVILTEGVHNGSEGPMYYPPAELGKTPVAWNHKPIVVYHPEMNGQAISACDPSVITNRKVGVMMNTVFEKGKLKSEAWLEKDRADKVDERIMAAINDNEMMEVSTGVFVDCEAEEGEWKGEAYKGIARNYRPDHLAILPDKIGACSIADGAGLLRNQSNSQRGALGKTVARVLAHMGLMADNELSFSNVREALSTALQKKLNIPANTMSYTGPYCYVEDVYSNFVIYSFDGKLWRIGYTTTDADGVVLNDEKPVEVHRVTEYRTVTGAFVGNQDQQSKTKPEDQMKKQIIDKIIGNAASGFTEADRANLDALSEAQLTRIAGTEAPAAAPAANTQAPVAAPAPVAQAPAANVIPMPKTPSTMEEYVAAAPPAMREVLNNSLSVYTEEKNKLVDGILANKNHGFTKAELENRPLGELRNLARLAGVDAAPAARLVDYSGQGTVPTGNANAEEALEMPTINFEKKAASAS